MSKYLANRQFPRLVPQNSIPVSIHDGEHGQTFGLITNLSEGGSSFDSGVAYAAGSKILLRISFDREAEPFVAEATVAWSREADGKSKGFVHGVRFSILEEEQLQLLRVTLQRPEFQIIFRRHREFPRLVPHESIDVSIANDRNEQAPGAIVNISEGGASFSTAVPFRVGSNVLLRISFDPDNPFVTEARIAWSREADGSNADPSFRFLHGVKFANMEEDQRGELQTALRRPEFKAVFIPEADSPGIHLPGAPMAELQTKSTTTE
jgi:Tfp pilus assembly protein PilZ